ncbi:MAG: DNA topoisomerase IB [Actinobacteria bacterium]|nr:DNA topoisomerase IB [Actinomycetota bacterium]
MTRLRRADCSTPGIERRGRGRGFEYRDARTGERVADPRVVERIKALAIPPAWRDVWICPHPHGHLQAVGTDAAGRRQYRYHDAWRMRRDREKFDRMLEFARRLPVLRDACAADLWAQGLGRDRLLACAVRLLDHGFFRIGAEEYAEAHETYGLTTVRKAHATLDGDMVRFDYSAKSGRRRVMSLVDPAVAEVVGACQRRRTGGPELLAYRECGVWRPLTPALVNEYLKRHAGPQFTSKDFRTWNATVLAAVAVAVSGGATSQAARRRAVSRAVAEVAGYLGNTPAVCRKSYIDPRVFDRFRSGWTIGGALEALGAEAAFGQPSFQGAVEAAVVDLLTDDRESDAVAPAEMLLAG